MRPSTLLWGCLIYGWAAPSWALHPLFTEDTGTQGTGATQVEFAVSLERDRDNDTRTRVIEPELVLTYGVTDHLDAILSVPYQFLREDDGTTRTRASGVSDASIGVKWRFYEQEGYSFATKPTLQFPTGDDGRGLGQGRANISIPLIFTRQWEHTALHVHGEYIGNRNTLGERKHLWHASIAVEHELHENLKLVADVGVDRNSQVGANQNPSILLVGAVIPVFSGAEFSVGYQRGLNKAAPDHKALLGLTWHFK